MACVNSVIVCIIAMRTAQFGFIPANVFCIAVNGMFMRSWMREPGRLRAAVPGERQQGICE